ncbi:MAG TPA: hypothetical protein DCS87_03095, partial [Rheinheimera sp.]|nr:hypothetical protein [Rheinheimera sp.]
MFTPVLHYRFFRRDLRTFCSSSRRQTFFHAQLFAHCCLVFEDFMLQIYNTLTRQKEQFKPLVEGKVGM